MPKPVAIGLKNFYLGEIATDGGMGTSLEAVSYSVIDTPVFNIPEGETVDFLIEESDTPYYSKSTPGVPTFTLSIYGLSAAVLAKHFGGVAVTNPSSAVADTWEAPATIPTFERSIVADHTQGGHLKIVRASITATIDWNFQKNKLPQINLVCRVLTPTKANTAPYSFSTAAYTP
jgi:hypothetical protein